MSKILIGIIFALSMALAFFYYQNKSLTALNQAYEVRDTEQKAAIESLQNDFELQIAKLIKQEEEWKFTLN